MFGKTKIYKLKNSTLSQAELAELSGILKAGKLIVFPTETVYGLGCFYAKEDAKAKIFKIKQREPHKKLPVIVRDVKTIESFFKCSCSPLTKDIMRKFMPGPITVILDCEGGNPLGFRIPSHEVVLDLISSCNEPLAATSANISGEEAAVDFQQASRFFLNKVAAIIDGGRCRLGKPSTVLDLRGEDFFKVVREGVYEENLIKVALSNPKTILFVCTGNSCRSVLAAAALKQMIGEEKNTDFKIISAGTAALKGMSLTQNTVEVLKESGLGHNEDRPKPLTEDMLKEADLVLAMEKMHIDYIVNRDIRFNDKTFGFLKFAFGLENDLEDPIGKDIVEYRKTFSVIKEATKEIVKKIT